MERNNPIDFRIESHQWAISLWKNLSSQLDRELLLPSLVAGLVSGLMGVLFDLSYTAFIFTGDLEVYLPIGIGVALFGAMLARSIVATLSSFPTAIADIDALSTTILAIVMAELVQSLVALDSEVLVSTILLTLAIAAASTGFFLLTLGHLRVGELVRFIPYPAIGGFLAGTGWLLTKGAIALMTGITLSWSNIARILDLETLVHWLPGAVFALVVFVLSRRYHHWGVVPGCILGAIGLFYSCLWLTQTSIADAIQATWLFEPFAEGIVWQHLSLDLIRTADWQSISHQWGNILTIVLIGSITILLNASTLELVTESDLDLNRELKTAGWINLAVGLSAGLVCFHSLSDSKLVYQIGARSRLVGWVTAGVYGLALLFGASAIALFPKFVLGGMLLFFGVSFLVTALYENLTQLSKADYFIVWMILLIIGTFGFLQGVGMGVVCAVVVFVVDYSQIELARQESNGLLYRSRVRRPPEQEACLQREGDRIFILELQGLIFFGTAHTLLERVRQRLNHPDLPPLEFCILDFRWVKGLDSSAVLSFTRLKQLAKQRQVKLVLTNLPDRSARKLQRSQILGSSEIAMATSMCLSFPDLDRGLEWCEDRLLEQYDLQSPQSLPLRYQLAFSFQETPDEISIFFEYLDKIQLKEGDYLFYKGDKPRAIYFVESGQLSTYVELRSEQNRRIRTLIPGTILGEISFHTRSNYQASAIADKPTELYLLTYDGLERMEVQHPQVAAKFSKFVNRHLARRLSFANQEIDNLLI